MSDLRAALSGLTTRGRCLLAGGAVLAAGGVLLGQRDLLRAGLFLLVLPLAAVAVVSRTRYRLACVRRLEPGRVAVGTAADVHLRLDNVSRLPSGVLRMEDALPYALGSRPRFVLDRVEPRGVRDVTYAVTATARGHYRVGPLSVRLVDPFGLCELARAFTTSSDLVVTPALTALPPVPLGGDWAGGGDSASRAAASAGSDDVTTREYRYGDDLRKVHWRSTARTGELMVRREEQPFQSRAVLLLDTRARAHRGDGPGSSFEWAVSAVASAGVSLLRAGFTVSLVLDDERELVPRGVTLTEGLLLDVLAGVQPGPGRDLAGAAERLRRGVDGVLLAVLGELDAASADRLARLRTGSATCAALLLDVRTWGTDVRPRAAGPDPAGALRATGWRAVPVPVGTDLAAAWSELGGRAGPASGRGTGPVRPAGQQVPA